MSNRPMVAFIGTGGTISSLGTDSLDILDYTATRFRLTADVILDRVPEARDLTGWLWTGLIERIS